MDLSDFYIYRVMWSEKDEEFVGLCSEYPGLSWLEPSPEKALLGIKETVKKVVKNMKKSGEKVPKPIMHKKYSGKFVVRIPPSLHRELSMLSAEMNISLNRLVSMHLAKIKDIVPPA